MKVFHKSKQLGIYVVCLLLFCLALPIYAFAASSNQVSAKLYESGDETSEYALSPDSAVPTFSYGKKAIGSFSLYGTTNKNTTINGFPAYAVVDGLTIQYSYDGSYKGKNDEEWHLISDSGKTAAGISLTKKIDDGVFIIQKSTDCINWENAADPIFNLFSARKVDWDNLYSLSEEELKAGTYFRVIIAYEMGRKTGEIPGSFIPPRLPSDVNEYVYCAEVYEFFASYGNSQLSLRDLSTGENVTTGAIVQAGFVIDKNGSSNSITVKRDSEPAMDAASLTSYTATGKYTITETTPVGQTYTYYIEVSGGLKTTSLSPIVYQNEKKNEYTLGTRLFGNTAFGIPSHTVLMIGQNSSTSIVSATHNGYDAYGITGNSASIYLRLQGEDTITSNGWEIVTDTWGKRNSQTVDGVHVGQVNSGAIVIQTSADGENWINADMDRYADGLYTTDYETYYGDRGDVLIYTPDGNDILNGVYIRILYAYEIKNSNAKEDYRIIEEYKFFLCSNELDAVTFHNLSIEQTLEEICEGYDDATAQIYQQAETLKSGDYTVSGFRIDNSLNPTVTYTITRNGEKFIIPSSNVIDQSGKYEINLRSAVNSTKKVILYVDRMSTEEALSMYFGENFILGKRIYSEGEYAVYEGGLSEYQILAVGENYLPVGGQITNLTTGEVVEIPATRTAKSGVLRSPGLYEAILSTNPEFESEETSGDCRIFIFHFRIIVEGTAPGPVVNQESLLRYAATTISDSYPKYYGLSFSSASKGNITLAFATREAAVAYAMTYEQGMVERQSDGRYRYIGSFITRQKELYESNWDVMDAVEFFANQAVQELYFDLSDDFTVITLPEEVIDATSNLRTLELNKSVVIFAQGQKAALTDIDALPLIARKPYYYLSPGLSGTVSSGFYDFEFVHDDYRCDSDSVTIIDANGKEYSINYNEGVGAQLARYGCPSGVVTIVERTVYGDTATYQAVYIADGYNSAEVTLAYYCDGAENEYTYNQESIDRILSAEVFSIREFRDDLDPYSIVIVSHNGSHYSYVADKAPMDAWADPGLYTVKVVNRLGFSYSFTVKVVESDYATISFAGEGTENTGYILTRYGQQHVALPAVTRYGYNLIGYKDDSGVLYQGEIASIPFSGSVVLTSVWEAKQYTLTLLAPDGSLIKTEPISFGKPVELPIPIVDDGYTFEGWSLDGDQLDSRYYTLRSENDVTLVAIETATGTNENTNTENSAQKSSGILVWCVVAIAVVLVGLIIRVKHSKKIEKDASSLSGKKEDGDA